MKITFDDFLLEFNKQDKELIKSIGDKFTVAIEYELCLDEDPSEEPSIEDEEKALEATISQTLLDLSRGKTIGLYMFSDDKWSESRFKNNEKKMLADHPEFSTYTKKKKQNLHKKYKTWTWINEFLTDLSMMVDFDDLDDTLDELDPENWKDELEQIIVRRFAYNAEEFCFQQNLEYLKDRIAESIPNFWKRWGNTFKFELEGDVDKQRILEFSPKSYVKGLDNAVQQINDFYDDFEKQNTWYLNNRTALHINVGVVGNADWNPIKGLLFMSDIEREKKAKPAYVFKDIEWRSESRFAGSLIDTLLNDFEKKEIFRKESGEVIDTAVVKLKDKLKELQDELKLAKGKRKKELQDSIDNIRRNTWNLEFRKKENILKNKEEFLAGVDLTLRNVEEFEKIFNNYLIKSNADYYQKEFGLKLIEIKNNYVEFRFIGGKSEGRLGGMTRNVMLDKLHYFCYLVHAMTDKEFKKKDYQKKLYKFVQLLKSKIDKSHED